MRALTRKLWRDLARAKGQAAAIALVLAAGVAMVVMSLGALDSLRATQDRWLERSRFADAFASVVRAPLPLAGRLAALPGVQEVDTRIVRDVTLDVPGLREPAVGRLVSVEGEPDRGLNRLHLRRGRWIDPTRPDEALLGEAFAEAHGLGPGDRLRAVIHGRRRTLHVVGVALSPEYVYAFRPGDVLPDERRFGVLWLARRDLAAAFGMEGAFDDLALDLAPGADRAEVLRRVDLLTAPYGGTGAYGREDQLSHKLVTNELRQLRAMATVPPALFLAVGAFLLHLTVARMVGTQREQVAALRAFGYRRREVAAHYLSFVVVVAAVGAALGLAAGLWLARGLTRDYARFFRFPDLELRLSPAAVGIAVGVTVGAALLGALASVARACALPPAEAMRPEPPPRYRPTLAERLGLGGLLSPAARMILRHLERRPLRTALSGLAVALGCAVMILGGFVQDTLDEVIDLRFARTDRSDLRLSLAEPASPGALGALGALPGVLRAEPVRDVAVRFVRGPRAARGGVQGLDPAGRLFVLHDEEGRAVPLPPRGLVLSERLAALLDARAGDAVRVEVLERRGLALDVTVARVVRDVAGSTAYASLAEVHGWLGEGDVLTGAWADVDEARLDDLYDAVKEAPRVAGAGVKAAALAGFRATIGENLLRMQVGTLAFAVVLACGVVYNAARISLAERTRELATLRVVGFTRAEISLVLLGELVILTLLAVPVGLWIGRGFAALAMAALTTEEFRFPLVVSERTYATAAAVTFGAAVLSGLAVRRRLDRLDLVGVLKAQE